MDEADILAGNRSLYSSVMLKTLGNVYVPFIPRARTLFSLLQLQSSLEDSRIQSCPGVPPWLSICWIVASNENSWWHFSHHLSVSLNSQIFNICLVKNSCLSIIIQIKAALTCSLEWSLFSCLESAGGNLKGLALGEPITSFLRCFKISNVQQEWFFSHRAFLWNSELSLLSFFVLLERKERTANVLSHLFPFIQTEKWSCPMGV